MDGFAINGALIAALTPIIIGIVQVTKNAGMEDRWGGVAALVLGLTAGTIVAVTTGAWVADVGAGLVAGLPAAGVYSGAKSATR